MKTLLVYIFILFLLTSCGTTKYIPVKGEDIYHTEYITKDSIVYTPVETVKEVVPQLDTLTLESSLAKANAYLDTTTLTLKGELHNKRSIIYKDKIIFRDSIIISKEEIPIPVEIEKKTIPKWCYYSVLLNCGLIIFFLGKKLVKFYFRM